MARRPKTHRNVSRNSRKSRDHSRTTTERGLGWAWQKLRLQVLRDEPLCRMCKADGFVEPAREVDHIVPRSRGGTDDWKNLQPLCVACHQKKSAKECSDD